MSRRSVDAAIKAGRVNLNGQIAVLGDEVKENDTLTLDNGAITPSVKTLTIMLNKPAGYVVSRDGQGSKTIYDLLPKKYHKLKPVGRLDKDSSGLLLLSDDGELANELTHPRYQKEKVYRARLNKNISATDKNKLLTGVVLSDGLSKFIRLSDCSNNIYEVTLSEGKNRQIRRTLNALGYKVESLHRTQFGKYILNVDKGQYKEIT